MFTCQPHASELTCVATVLYPTFPASRGQWSCHHLLLSIIDLQSPSHCRYRCNLVQLARSALLGLGCRLTCALPQGAFSDQSRLISFLRSSAYFAMRLAAPHLGQGTRPDALKDLATFLMVAVQRHTCPSVHSCCHQTFLLLVIPSLDGSIRSANWTALLAASQYCSRAGCSLARELQGQTRHPVQNGQPLGFLRLQRSLTRASHLCSCWQPSGLWLLLWQSHHTLFVLPQVSFSMSMPQFLVGCSSA